MLPPSQHRAGVCSPCRALRRRVRSPPPVLGLLQRAEGPIPLALCCRLFEVAAWVTRSRAAPTEWTHPCCVYPLVSTRPARPLGPKQPRLTCLRSRRRQTYWSCWPWGGKRRQEVARTALSCCAAASGSAQWGQVSPGSAPNSNLYRAFVSFSPLFLLQGPI